MSWAAGRAEKGKQVLCLAVGWGHGQGVRSCSRAAGEKPCAGIGLVHRLVLPCPPRYGLCTLTSKLGGFWPRAVATLGNGTRAAVAGAQRGLGGALGCTGESPQHQHSPEHVRAQRLQTLLREPRAASTAIKSRGSSSPTSWHSGNLPGSRCVHASLAHLCTVEKHCKGSQLIGTAEVEKQNPGNQFLLNWRPVAFTKPGSLCSPAFLRSPSGQGSGTMLPTKAPPEELPVLLSVGWW